MNCYLCAVQKLFSILLKSQADEDLSLLKERPITFKGKPLKGHKSSAFLKMDKPLNFVSGEKYQNGLTEF